MRRFTRSGRLVTCLLSLTSLLVWARPVETAQLLALSFDDEQVGSAPSGLFLAAARQASPGSWEIGGTGPLRHLVHLADPSVTMRGISIAGVSSIEASNLTVTADIKLIDGDRAGGIMWRYSDAENFYFSVLDLNRHSAALFRVSNGNRIRLDYKGDVDLDPLAWHVMTVAHDGAQMRAHIDGIGILSARDEALKGGRRAGVWSAGNSTTWFDDVTVEPN